MKSVVLSLLAIVSTSCMNVLSEVTLDADGSGTVKISLEFGEMLSGMFGSGDSAIGGTTEESLAEFGLDDLSEGLPAGVTPLDVEVTETNGKLRIDAELAFDSPEDLIGALTSGAADEDPMFEEFSLEETDSGWEMSAVPVDEFASPGDTGAVDPDDPFAELDSFLADSLGTPEVEFAMTFPGDVTQSNATSVSGGTATWDLTEAGLTELNATSGSKGLSTTVVAAIVGLALVLLLAVLLVMRSRDTTPQPATADPSPSDPNSGQPTWEDASSNASPHETSAPAAEAGWYPDPKGKASQRYWDGTAWTDQVN